MKNGSERLILGPGDEPDPPILAAKTPIKATALGEA
jgi:hypothetical protein